MNFILNAYALQDIGTRDNQEDCFFPPFIDPCHFDESGRDWSFYDGIPHRNDRLFIVCDGMGGHDRGEEASRIVTKAMSDCITTNSPADGSFSDDLMHNAVEAALQALYTQEDPNEMRKMGTTMTALVFHSDGAIVAHIGDSRVYQFRPARITASTRSKESKAAVLFKTADHSVVNEMVRQGQLNAVQAASHPQRHVLSRCMVADKTYHPEVEIDHITDIKPDDIFLMCSDGIFEKMDDEKLCSLLCDPNYTDVELAQRLLRACNDNADNHTAYIIRVKDVINATDGKASEETLPQGTILQSQNYTYHIERVLGHGAFGITYLVSTSVSIQGRLGTIRTGVKVALKEFFMHDIMRRLENGSVDGMGRAEVEQYADKFRREASKMAMLSHPNIVKVLEVFEANNTYYYSMEYLPDGSLNEYINKRGGLPEQEALGYIRQIGSALHYLHTNRMLHLDVKPSNIMRDEAYNNLKLIDFGLAKVYEENGEAESSAYLGAGTSGYAPLEQADRNTAIGFSPQLDVYALGATYYKILTGEAPSAAVDVLNNGLYTLPLVKHHVSQQSIDAIKAAMQPVAANRLKSVTEFLLMLPSVDDKAVYRPKKNKINWKTWMSVAVILAVIFAGSAVAIWLEHRSMEKDMQKVYGDNEKSVVDKNFKIPMVEVKGGEFLMGSNAKGAEKDEQPVHKVKLSTFWIGKYEVTQAQWNQVMYNKKPSKSKNNELPVYDVTWDAIQLFIKRLNERSGKHFRLPTEAEWEYAARGGTKDTIYRQCLDSMAWYNQSSEGFMHPVGWLKPNALGIYDMLGNAWEYCSDYYDDYSPAPQTNPKGPVNGTCHVIRGGGWNSKPHACRVTYRQDDSFPEQVIDIGFRLVEDKNGKRK